MFIGRDKEMTLLEELYVSTKFEFLVLYGRRRVGKTSLLVEFIKKHKAIFFSAQEKNNALNLQDFSKCVQFYFEGMSFTPFSDWEQAFKYIGSKCGDEKLVLIIDEFPFVASEYPAIKSILQHTIDHSWRDKNITLILCGSSISFMENEIMGYKSPLYGRSTMQLELKAFDYLESSKFFPYYSLTDRLLSYGILGGIPCYLASFDPSKSLKWNIAHNILRTGAFLQNEPQMLLKMELREPNIYNSIFEAIAFGASRLNDIATKIHEESYKCSKYVDTLRNLKLIEKKTPCGEKESSKKSIYVIKDNFYSFWYHFLFPNKTYYELLGEDESSKKIMEGMSDYMGNIFEQICTEYMVRLARKGQLPFVPKSIGRWWGNNPKKRMQDDIDILCLNGNGSEAIFCECKFRNEAFDIKQYEDLFAAAEIFTELEKRYYYIFSKGGFTDAVIKRSEEDGVELVDVENLFCIDD